MTRPQSAPDLRPQGPQRLVAVEHVRPHLYMSGRLGAAARPLFIIFSLGSTGQTRHVDVSVGGVWGGCLGVSTQQVCIGQGLPSTSASGDWRRASFSYDDSVGGAHLRLGERTSHRPLAARTAAPRRGSRARLNNYATPCTEDPPRKPLTREPRCRIPLDERSA